MLTVRRARCPVGPYALIVASTAEDGSIGFDNVALTTGGAAHTSEGRTRKRTLTDAGTGA